LFPSMRYPKRSQARQRQHSKLGWRGGCVLECFRLGGALDRAGAGTRESGWESGELAHLNTAVVAKQAE